MARQRRPAGQLCDIVLDLLRHIGRPVSGHALAIELAHAGHRVFSSQVFRTLNLLCDQRRIQRVELINSYLPGSPGETINLVCHACGSLTQIAIPAVIDDLTMLARRQNMQMDRAIVEISGLCHECRALD